MIHFRMRESFYSKPLRSHYVAGLTYTVRDGPDYDPLREELARWVAEGQAEIMEEGAGIAGSGAVAPEQPTPEQPKRRKFLGIF